MDKYLVSVGEARAFDTNGNLLFTGKTLLDTSMNIKVSSTDIRGGYGAPLLYVYYHSGDADFTITDTQWNLAYLALQAGASVTTGKNIFKKETVTLTGNTGTVSATPLAAFGSNLYGWVEKADGTTERVTFTGSNFTSTQSNGTVTIYYYMLNSAATSFTVPSNIVPSIVRLVVDTQLASSGSNENLVGKVQIDIPRASLTGNFQIQMKMDGAATSPLNVRALADLTTGTGKFMDITEVLTSANWYDNVIALSVVGGDHTLSAHNATYQLDVRAIPQTGSAFNPPYTDLTFTSGTPGNVTVSSSGLVTGVLAGTSQITVKITNKTTVETSLTITNP